MRDHADAALDEIERRGKGLDATDAQCWLAFAYQRSSAAHVIIEQELRQQLQDATVRVGSTATELAQTRISLNATQSRVTAAEQDQSRLRAELAQSEQRKQGLLVDLKTQTDASAKSLGDLQIFVDRTSQEQDDCQKRLEEVTAQRVDLRKQVDAAKQTASTALAAQAEKPQPQPAANDAEQIAQLTSQLATESQKLTAAQQKDLNDLKTIDELKAHQQTDQKTIDELKAQIVADEKTIKQNRAKKR